MLIKILRAIKYPCRPITQGIVVSKKSITPNNVLSPIFEGGRFCVSQNQGGEITQL